MRKGLRDFRGVGGVGGGGGRGSWENERESSSDLKGRIGQKNGVGGTELLGGLASQRFKLDLGGESGVKLHEVGNQTG